jgi:hypothetical protein
MSYELTIATYDDTTLRDCYRQNKNALDLTGLRVFLHRVEVIEKEADKRGIFLTFE